MRSHLFDHLRLDAALANGGVDALVVQGAANVRYTTGYGQGGGAYAVVVGGKVVAPTLIVPSASADYVLEGIADGVDVRVHGSFVRFTDDEAALDEREQQIRALSAGARTDVDGVGLVAELLSEANLGAGRIATDAPMPQLAALLPEARLAAKPELVRSVRMVKTWEELRRLREAAALAERAIEATVSVVAEGVSQDDLAREFSASVARAGGRVRMDNVSFGRSTAFGNANLPGDRLTKGSVVRFDVGAIVEGYASDLSRCFSFGEVEERASRYYAALLAGQERALDVVRPGKVAVEIFAAAVEEVRRSGIPHYERTNVGHGIGLFGDGYDAPLLGPTDDTILEPGMVLCVETPYYELGFGGLQVEDMVVVTDSGYEFLTHLPRELRVIP